jgi:hypothetical protein
MTKAEIVAALNTLADQEKWNIQIRGVKQLHDPGLTWMAKGISATVIVEAAGDTFEQCTENLIKKIVP